MVLHYELLQTSCIFPASWWILYFVFGNALIKNSMDKWYFQLCDPYASLCFLTILRISTVVFFSIGNAGHHQEQVTKQVDSSFTKLLEILLTPLFPLYNYVYTKKLKSPGSSISHHGLVWFCLQNTFHFSPSRLTTICKRVLSYTIFSDFYSPLFSSNSSLDRLYVQALSTLSLWDWKTCSTIGQWIYSVETSDCLSP